MSRVRRAGCMLLRRWGESRGLSGGDESRPLRGGRSGCLCFCLGMRRGLGLLLFCRSLEFRLWRRGSVLHWRLALGIGLYLPSGGIRCPSLFVSSNVGNVGCEIECLHWLIFGGNDLEVGIEVKLRLRLGCMRCKAGFDQRIIVVKAIDID